MFCSDLLPALKSEASNELTPRQWRRGLRTTHNLLGVTAFRFSPRGRSCPRYPYRKADWGYGLRGQTSSKPSVFGAWTGGFWRTLNSVHFPSSWRRHL